LNTWVERIARSPPASGPGPARRTLFAILPQTPDEHRARKATANRIRTILVAMLNHAVAQELVPTGGHSLARNEALRKGRQAGDRRFITEHEAKRRIAATSLPFRVVVQEHYTLVPVMVSWSMLGVTDIKLKERTVYFAPSKSGEARHVPLSDAGVKFFTALTDGEATDSPLRGMTAWHGKESPGPAPAGSLRQS
jgi:hypothetical protein